jgi:hypothetical protein
MKREAHLQGILRISQKPQLLGSPVKEPSLKIPFMESLAERCPTTRALLHSSIKMERGPYGERYPCLETFLTYLPGSPVKELSPPEAPSTEPLQRETLHPQSPLHPSLEVHGR